MKTPPQILPAGMFAALLFLFASCSAPSSPVDVGQGFEAFALHAPWSGCSNGTRFSCHGTEDRFFFPLETVATALVLHDAFQQEKDVNKEDRVELFFSPTQDLSRPYYCAEIDAEGRVMDYKAVFFRKFDFDWNFSTLETFARKIPGGYRMGGSIGLEELRALGLDLENGFWMGVFQGDSDGREMVWYSLVPTGDEVPDFHKPGVLMPCRITPKAERTGVVLYPDDITSVGLKEWKARILASGINLIGLHAATANDPIDTLEAFIRSKAGKDFLRLCKKMDVDVEYELHAIRTLLPRELFQEHPEYFREDGTGRRVADYNCCFSSPEAVEAMRPQLEKLLQWMKPTTHRYFLWADDKQWKFCHCEKCRGYSPSEQTLMYESRLLDMLREYDPQATLAHLTYHQTLDAPVKVKAPEGIFMEFAPIYRDYSQALPEETLTQLKENLLAFPPHTQHILEYWLDASLVCRWKKDSLQRLDFHPEACARDIKMYRRLGARSITQFATWLNADYEALYGTARPLFEQFGAAAKH